MDFWRTTGDTCRGAALDLSWHFCVWTVAEWNKSDLFDIVVYLVTVVPVVRGAQGLSLQGVLLNAVLWVCLCVEERPSSLTGL